MNEKGERLIWLDPSMVDRLRSLGGPGESYSDVILRLARDPRGLEGQDPQRSSLVPRPSIARAVHGVGG